MLEATMQDPWQAPGVRHLDGLMEPRDATTSGVTSPDFPPGTGVWKDPDGTWANWHAHFGQP
ncbi:hypothetical protein, partial [Crossiella sp. CA198]|uniref:hypothetical protein n=1 Tax=Crossiella sp. CA198 TaxID=3455607 RepID=UPI003F8D02CB